MAYSAWDYLSEVLDRTGSKELNFTKERLDAVKGRVPMIIIDGDHHKLMMGTPEAWPESERRIDVIGSNGNTGLHYDDFEVDGA